MQERRSESGRNREDQAGVAARQLCDLLLPALEATLDVVGMAERARGLEHHLLASTGTEGSVRQDESVAMPPDSRDAPRSGVGATTIEKVYKTLTRSPSGCDL